MLRPQSHFRFTPDADPSWCASVVKHMNRRVKPTHVVTLGKQSFNLCASCARPYEGMSNIEVEKIMQHRPNSSEVA